MTRFVHQFLVAASHKYSNNLDNSLRKLIFDNKTSREVYCKKNMYVDKWRHIKVSFFWKRHRINVNVVSFIPILFYFKYII